MLKKVMHKPFSWHPKAGSTPAARTTDKRKVALSMATASIFMLVLIGILAMQAGTAPYTQQTRENEVAQK